MKTWLKISGVILAVIASCSPENVHGKNLRCSCQMDNIYSRKFDIHCEKTSNAVSSNTDEKTVSCEKEVKRVVPKGYKYIEGFGLYKIHRTTKNFEGARQFCEYEGASLMVPESAEEVRRLRPLFKAIPLPYEAFISVTDVAKEGTFVTQQGVPLTSLGYQKWRHGQPDNRDDEDCLTISVEGDLNDVSCASYQAFICKRNVTHVPAGYEYVEGLGFYKLYTGPYNFNEARKQCEGDGAALAVPETYDEALAIIELYDKEPRVHFGWIGITDEVKEGLFATLTGTPLTSLQFQNWGRNEPDSDFPLGEDCVVLQEYGVIYDAYCLEEKAFTCEIPVL